jgi:hypothetical protein
LAQENRHEDPGDASGEGKTGKYAAVHNRKNDYTE